MRRIAKLIGPMAAILATGGIAAAQGESAAGIWTTEKGDATVRVRRCGDGICGIVVGLKQPIDPNTGQPQRDDKNPNPAQAQRPIIGINLFNNMRPAGPDRWSGYIYNADDGKFYQSNVSLTGPNALRVEGCVGGALCGGETWTRSGR